MYVNTLTATIQLYKNDNKEYDIFRWAYDGTHKTPISYSN